MTMATSRVGNTVENSEVSAARRVAASTPSAAATAKAPSAGTATPNDFQSYLAYLSNLAYTSYLQYATYLSSLSSCGYGCACCGGNTDEQSGSASTANSGSETTSQELSAIENAVAGSEQSIVNNLKQ